MDKNSPSNSQTNEYQIRGYHVKILVAEEKETLLINGEEVQYIKSDGRYQIAYIPPQSSLLEAITRYLDNFSPFDG